MQVEKKLSDFISNSLSVPSQKNLICFFDSVSSQDEINQQILRENGHIPSNEQKFVIDTLSDFEAWLLIIRNIIVEWRKSTEYGMEYSSISIHASDRERERVKETYQKNANRYDRLNNDFQKVYEELYRSIETRLANLLPSFLEVNGLLKNRCNIRCEIPGYRFCFYENKIVVVNWYPMGGD